MKHNARSSIRMLGLFHYPCHLHEDPWEKTFLYFKTRNACPEPSVPSSSMLLIRYMMGPLLNPELPGSVPQGLPWHWILVSTCGLLLVNVQIRRKLMYSFQSWYPLISFSIVFSWFHVFIFLVEILSFLNI